ncbi:uncharacterized protein LOC130446885, partial [Diorhabda sublineata]|uniref:uncharacterized protein LOC130446885 n=1 Tax=Diorhabda sublineata TaxID=1163346 RepID=UPI0024E12205
CVSQIVNKRNLESDHCDITYYKSHYLHGSHEIQHLQIPKSDKQMIAPKLILGVPSKGTQKVRANIGEDLKRNDLLTSTDIRNIERAYNIDLKYGFYHKDDATSVNIWVKQCAEAEDNPLLFYKQQGQSIENFEPSDFCLIIMTGVQRSILKEFGNQVITIDETHGLNTYDFELTTLLTLDEFRQGYPVAFKFTNCKDTSVYQFFFSKVKDVVGLIKNTVFMSDITDIYYMAIYPDRIALISKFNLMQKDLFNWSLKNDSNEYIVTKQSENNNVCCSIKCPFCNICIHPFKCSCIDFCIRTTICKHIHYVAINSEQQNNNNIPLVTSRII